MCTCTSTNVYQYMTQVSAQVPSKCVELVQLTYSFCLPQHTGSQAPCRAADSHPGSAEHPQHHERLQMYSLS